MSLEVKEDIPPWLKLVREPSKLPQFKRITSPQDTHALLKDLAAIEEVEVFWVITLNTKLFVTGIIEITRGVLNSSLVHPREVFRQAIIYGAAGIIVAHNHPSGQTTPSADDKAVVQALLAAGKVVDVQLYDALIVTENAYFSFAEAGLL